MPMKVNRRQLITMSLAGGLLGLCRPVESATGTIGERVTDASAPDHPFAQKKRLVYGLGISAARILRDATEEPANGCWLMWAAIRNDCTDDDVLRWGTELYPFSERNVTRLEILTRLGDTGAGLVQPTLAAWRTRLPVEILLLEPEADADDATRQRAVRQWAQFGGWPDLLRLGASESEAMRVLNTRAGWEPAGESG